MRKRPFEAFAAEPQQPLAARTANPSTIAIDGVARLGLASSSCDVRDPVPRCSCGRRRLRDPRATDCCDSPCRRRPLRGRRRRGSTASTCSAASISVSRLVVVSPSSASCTVTATIAPVSRSTACSALCARCVRPSFIFVIFASGSCGCVQSSFEPFFFRFRSSRARSSRVGVSMPDACASCVRKLLIALAGIAPHDAAQRRIRFQRRRIDADRLALHQLASARRSQHPREHGLMRLDIDQPPRARHRRMIGRRLVQLESQKARARSTNRPRARRSRAPSRGLRSTRAAASGNSDPAADPDARSRRRRSATERLDVAVEVRLIQDLIQSRVERVRGAPRQVSSGHPHRRLLRAAPSFAHRHRP